ncbi:hypothetical protein CXF83_06545 [Shewanella sp. Choline-02u-19]|uniref:hypothetical protein n=1 Tax=unclassified Shewanella TaxID=196818 RepID=UPI000C332959|nr:MULTISPECIES: hypothetical protein [unclassified Shewanella]PKH56737.1 hypothetical protein CXF84_12565 [Shewanella sp. Bg11-22]PKI30288.1 hypothetical protein CXF83_06545 [Shewanella sp. Choline-02u-19]
MDELLIIGLFILIVSFNTQRSTDKRLRVIEHKIDSLLKNNGIFFHNNINVSKEVLTAITLGKKLTAIRLYRKDTGASLKEARGIINRLAAKTASLLRQSN